MRRRCLFASLVIASFCWIAGCSGSGSSLSSGGGASQISLAMKDAPPQGVSVISFEVSVTGATLQPGNVDLLAGSGPIQIEVKRLEVETAFLGTVSVPPGSGPFTTLNLTFATPELTFQNNTGTTITVGSKTCLSGVVCEVPPTGTLTASFNFNPSLSITPGSNIGLNVDVRLDTLLTSPTLSSVGVDFSLAGAVTVAQSQLKTAGELEDVDDVFGTVQNRNISATPNTFDLKTSGGSVLKGIQVDNNTQFDGFVCNPVNLANCVQNGDMVEVDLDLLPSGVLLAKRIEKENEQANEQDLEGIVFAFPPTTPTNTFQMAAVENASSLPVSVLGSPVTISVQSGANFEVDTEGLNLNSTQQLLATAFTGGGISSLQVGQNIQVQLVTGSGGAILGDGSAANPFVAKRVRLRMSRFTATVSTQPAAGNFNAAPVPGSLLDAAGVTTIQVQTSSQTGFEGVSDVTGLSATDTVSLRGLLFKGPPVTLVAGKVRKK